MKLHISNDLSLPTDAITQTLVLLGIRGSGKTHTLDVLIEEILKAAVAPAVVVDPTGAHWGLRSSIDGKSEGFPIVVMGGEHGDVPLEDTAGETIADAIVDERMSAILDLSLFSKGQQVKFMTAFAERLYLRNREPLHLAIDEVDQFAPQKPFKGEERLLGAIDKIVRLGRIRGLGVSMASQRPAVINKNVLTQAECLVALRTLGKHDLDAIEAWVERHGDRDKRDQMMAVLPEMPNGCAWFWSPSWLKVFKKVQIRHRETFDSSATPKVGQKRIEPKRLAPVDLEKLSSRIAATIERAKAEDPKALKATVARLERELEAAKAHKCAPAAAAKPRVVEIPILDGKQLASLERMKTALGEGVKHLEGLQRAVFALSKRGAGQLLASGSARVEPVRPKQSKDPAAGFDTDGNREEPGRGDELIRLEPRKTNLLNVLAEMSAVGIVTPTRAQLALWAGRGTATGSTYVKDLGELNTAGYISYPRPGQVVLTEIGRSLASPAEIPADSAELQRRVCGILEPRQQAIVKQLVAYYPDSATRASLAEALGRGTPTGSTFVKDLGELKTLQVLEYPSPGEVRASDILFLKANA